MREESFRVKRYILRLRFEVGECGKKLSWSTSSSTFGNSITPLLVLTVTGNIFKARCPYKAESLGLLLFISWLCSHDVKNSFLQCGIQYLTLDYKSLWPALSADKFFQKRPENQVLDCLCYKGSWDTFRKWRFSMFKQLFYFMYLALILWYP